MRVARLAFGFALASTFAASPGRASDLVVRPADQSRIVIDVLSDTHCPSVCGTPPPRCPDPPCPDSIPCCDTFRAIVLNQNARAIRKDFTFNNGDLTLTSDAVLHSELADRFFQYWNMIPGPKAYSLGNHEADAAPDPGDGEEPWWVDPENHYSPANLWEPLFGCESNPSAGCRRWYSVWIGDPPRVAWLVLSNNSDDIADDTDYKWCSTPNDRLNHASSPQRQWLSERIDALPPSVEVVFVAAHRAYYGVENFSHRPNVYRSKWWDGAPPETLRTGAVSLLRDLESIRDRAPSVRRVFVISGDQHCFSETRPIYRNERNDDLGLVYITTGISGGWIDRGFYFPALNKIPPGTLVHAFQNRWGSLRFEVGPEEVRMWVHEAYTDSLLHESAWSLGPSVVAASETAYFDADEIRASPNPSPSGMFLIEFSPRRGSELAELADAAVFDGAGRRVAELVPSSWTSGAYRFDWNGRDREQHVVANGRYFAVVRRANGAATTAALTVLR